MFFNYSNGDAERRAVVLNSVATRENGEDTSARPGRLIRFLMVA